jgi:hypothetical protein
MPFFSSPGAALLCDSLNPSLFSAREGAGRGQGLTLCLNHLPKKPGPVASFGK